LCHWRERIGGMSAPLVLLILIGMAAIAWSACFIGCDVVLGLTQITDYDLYQSTVTTTHGLVAFWPLDETSGTVAADLAPNHFNGTYAMGPVVTTYDAAQQSDISPGTFALNQTNIVPGDTVNGNPAAPNPSVYFDGGYVSVPWQPSLGPAKFTLEAWVKPDWTLADAQTNPSFRVVVSTSAAPAAFTGFVLFASPDNLWTAAVGIGAQDVTTPTTGSNQTIAQGMLYFLVVTYDGSTLTLWVNPADTMQKITASASGYVPAASPVPLYIGTGAPDMPTPLFPFKGSIQDVAFYNVVLDDKIIETHYLNGQGMQGS
jgi:hypothetical protein